MEISMSELGDRLHGMLTFDFGPHERRLISRFLRAAPSIRIEKRHIQKAVEQHERGRVTKREQSDWAAMLLMNDAYDWEGPDEEEIAEALNELAILPVRE
jgi:hypothetical protein